MTKADLKCLLAWYYEQIYSTRPPIELNDRQYAGTEAIDEDTLKRHLRWMCAKAITFVDSGGVDGLRKAATWLGYVQGEMRAFGKYSIKSLRDHSRSSDHPDYPCCEGAKRLVNPWNPDELLGGICWQHGRSVNRQKPPQVPTYMNNTFAPDADAMLRHLLLDLTWLEVTPARKEYFMSDVPRSYAYKVRDDAGSHMRDYHSSRYTPPVDVIREQLNAALDARFNVCFLNRYDDQRNHLGWHADDSPEMDHDHPIAVVSFGVVREIWWKPKLHKGPIPAEWRRELEPGSVFVMPAGFQRDYLHRIPKCDRQCGVRVSLTFRRYVDKKE
jgi:alkylated DNA repair dioxygenase AlkB